MLHQHTLDQLRGLRLDGMIAALNDTATQAAAEALPFEQRLALIVQRELDWRDGKRVARLLKNAKLKVSSACVEDIDWRAVGGDAIFRLPVRPVVAGPTSSRSSQEADHQLGEIVCQGQVTAASM
jgi:hypothetical protein